MTVQAERRGEVDHRKAGHPPLPGVRRRLPSIVTPILIFLTVLAVLIWTAGEALRPARTVSVQPALPVVSSSLVFTTEAITSDTEGTSVVQTAADRDDAAAGPPPAPPASPPTTRTVQAAGWLEAEPHHVAASALISGIIEEILVLEGDVVEARQVVATLVADELDIDVAEAEATLAVAAAEIAQAEAKLIAAEATWNNPVERVRAVDTAVAELAETEAQLARLPAEVQAAQARLERLQEEIRRARDARNRGAATDFEVLILEKDAAAQAAEVKALQGREGVLAAQRDRLRAELHAAERLAELRIDESRERAFAKADLRLAEAAERRAQQALARAKLSRDRAAIRAPISGVVQRRLKIPGDKVSLEGDDPASAQVLHMYDPEHLQVRVDVPLADAAHVFPGQACEISVEVLPDRTFNGVVTRITHEADLQKNTLQAKVRVLAPDPLLRPEMLSRVRFLPVFHDAQPPTDGRGNAGAAAAAGARTRDPEFTSGATEDGAAMEREGSVASWRGEALVDRACLIIGRDPREAMAWIVRERRLSRGIAQRVRLTLIHDDGALDDAVRDAAAEGPAQWVRVAGEIRAGDLLIVLPPDNLVEGERIRFVDDREATGATARVEVREATDPRLVHAARSGGDR